MTFSCSARAIALLSAISAVLAIPAEIEARGNSLRSFNRLCVPDDCQCEFRAVEAQASAFCSNYLGLLLATVT